MAKLPLLTEQAKLEVLAFEAKSSVVLPRIGPMQHTGEVRDAHMHACNLLSSLGKGSRCTTLQRWWIARLSRYTKAACMQGLASTNCAVFAVPCSTRQ